MSLIVFVPFVASVNAVEVPWLTRSVLVFPGIGSRVDNEFFQVVEFLLFVHVLLGLGTIHSLGLEICSRCCASVDHDTLGDNRLLLGRLWNKQGRGDRATLGKLQTSQPWI